MEPYSWLGAGALTVGVGAAMLSGAGIASADDSSDASVDKPSSSTPSHSSPSAPGANAQTNGNTTTTAPTSAEGVGTAAPKVTTSGSTKKTLISSVSGTAPKTTLSFSGGFLQSETRQKSKSADASQDRDIAQTAPKVEEDAVASWKVSETPASAFDPAPSRKPVAVALSQPAGTISAETSLDSDLAGPVNTLPNRALRTLALVSTSALVDPTRAVYIKQFTDADPTGQFYTPASTNYVAPPPGTVATPIAEAAAQFGTAGFSRDAQNNLVYKNTTNGSVAVLFGKDPAKEAEGIRVARPGNSVTIPGGSAQYAVAEGPRSAGSTTNFNNAIAVAGPGYPPSKAATQPPPAASNPIASVLQAIGNTVKNTVQTISTAVKSTIQYVSDAVTTAVRTVIGVVTSNAQQTQNILKATFEGGLFGAADYLQTSRNIKVLIVSQPSPQTTGSLYLALRHQTSGDDDGIVVNKIAAADGNRYVVYLGGTDLLSTTNQPLVKNLPSYNGQVDLHQVNVIRSALGNDVNGKIMLVGYSQGGLDARNIAAAKGSLGLNVTTVVTYGAPINRLPPSDGSYRIINIQDYGDNVPKLFNNPLYFGDNESRGTIFRGSSRSNLDTAQIQKDFFYVHGSEKTYSELGEALDAQSYAAEDYIKKFRTGGVIAVYGKTGKGSFS